MRLSTRTVCSKALPTSTVCSDRLTAALSDCCLQLCKWLRSHIHGQLTVSGGCSGLLFLGLVQADRARIGLLLNQQLVALKEQPISVMNLTGSLAQAQALVMTPSSAGCSAYVPLNGQKV